MAAFKNKENGTWYVQFRYTDWKAKPNSQKGVISMAFGFTNMPGTHKNTHKTGDVDAITRADIGTALASHTHDDRYYPKSEIDTKLAGKAASNHGTHVSYSTAVPLMDGSASVGSASTVARSDHQHPTDTSRAAASHIHKKSEISDFPGPRSFCAGRLRFCFWILHVLQLGLRRLGNRWWLHCCYG